MNLDALIYPVGDAYALARRAAPKPKALMKQQKFIVTITPGKNTKARCADPQPILDRYLIEVIRQVVSHAMWHATIGEIPAVTVEKVEVVENTKGVVL